MMTAMLCVENIIAGRQLHDQWQMNEDAEYLETTSTNSTSGLRGVPQRVSAS